MITLHGLTKRYGEKTAVEDLSLEIRPGRVTGFLGPNGAGKSTTMRMIVGLDAPTEGSALVGGVRYPRLRHPLREVGALLDAKSVHPGRKARQHLLAMARSNGIATSRADQVLDAVGLSEVAGNRVGTFSLGMTQRLGIAGALLGDPAVLLFDEPVNGLDLDGVRWVRALMRSLAAEGRTVLVSSHLMSEMQLTADQLVIIGRGRLIADSPTRDVITASSLNTVRVGIPEPAHAQALLRRLRELSIEVSQPSAGVLVVLGASVAQVGDLAHQVGARLHELASRAASLEDAYLELTGNSVEYAAPAELAGRTS